MVPTGHAGTAGSPDPGIDEAPCGSSRTTPGARKLFVEVAGLTATPDRCEGGNELILSLMFSNKEWHVEFFEQFEI